MYINLPQKHLLNQIQYNSTHNIQKLETTYIPYGIFE